jgi:hypothetical protein
MTHKFTFCVRIQLLLLCIAAAAAAAADLHEAPIC